MTHQLHDRVSVQDGSRNGAGEVVDFTEDGYLVQMDGSEGSVPREFDRARVTPEAIASVATADGRTVRLGDWVEAEYVNSPSTELRQVAGEVSHIERRGNETVLTLLVSPMGAERTVLLGELVAVGDD